MSAIHLAAVVVALASPSPSPSPSPSASLTEIGRVVTADRREERRSDAVRTTYVVSRAEIERRGDRTIGEALTHVPGVTVVRSGPLGALNDVLIDGFLTKSVLILLDGRPIGGAQIAQVDVGAISSTGVERIEVVEGGGATLYGAGAQGGVINIVTTAGAVREPLRAALVTGSFGERGVTLDSPSFAFERRLSQNNYSYPAIGATAAGSEVNADSASTSARARTQGRLGQVRVDVSAGLRGDSLGVPGDAEYLPLATTSRQRDTAADARVAFALDTKRANTSLELSATRRVLEYTFSPNDPAVAAGNLPGAPSLSTEGRVQASLRTVIPNGDGTLVAGIDLAHGVGRVDAGLSPVSAPFAQTAAYAQETVAFAGGGRIYGGLRAERDGGVGAALSPTLGGALPLGGGWRLRANAQTGFRAPDLLDRYFPGYSNPSLQPERSAGGDIALDATRLLGGASLRWFTENGSNIVYPNPAFSDPKAPPGTPALINAARFSIAGFVGDVHTRPYHNVVATLGVSDTYRAFDLTSTAVRLPRRPVFTTTFGIEHLGDARGVFAGAGVLASSVGPHADAFTTSPASITEFTRIDAYARLRLAPDALVTLRGRNLGNERYADVAGFPQPGRSFSLELSNR